MKIYHNKQALTLTELLVASILIGIVMLGVAAFSVSVRQIQDSTSKLTILSMKTSGAMSIMSRKATLAVGDQLNPGIVIGDESNGQYPAPAVPPIASPGTPTWIAFRNEGVSTTPGIYTDDKWYVYISCSKSGGNGGYDLWENIFDAGVTGGLDAIPTCTGQPIVSASGFKILDNLNTFVFNFTADASLFQFYISITLDSIDDIAKSLDPINNPTYSLTTRVSPVAHSW